MRKCKYCNHFGLTETGEKVCYKHLIYLGDNNDDVPCDGVEMSIDVRLLAIAAIVAVIILITINAIC